MCATGIKISAKQAWRNYRAKLAFTLSAEKSQVPSPQGEGTTHRNIKFLGGNLIIGNGIGKRDYSMSPRSLASSMTF